ncbi:CHAT domain-containing protein [Micromonospora arida]|uniref:CHAT domain-containing protein n=1 Tax=Micromonospora arida TaxID=2203715 RepID=UPI0033E80CEA
MVSFSLSYPTDRGGDAARLLDDALTTRFGGENVLVGVAGAVEGSADLRRRLAASAALIVVIGPHIPGVPEVPSRNLPDITRREIETAFELQIPVIPVLVGGAELPFETELPEPLRPLARQQYRRIHAGTLREDIRHLVDDLARSFGAKSENAGPVPVIRLILSAEPVRLFMPPPKRRPAVTIVYSTRRGDWVVADSSRPIRWWNPAIVARFVTRYEVDTSDHRVDFHVRLPAKGGAYHFEASISVRFRVTDPAQIVRRPITDAAGVILKFLLEICRPVTRQFGPEEVAEAAAALDGRLAREVLVPEGITLYTRGTRLSLDDHARNYVRERESQRARRYLQERAKPRVEFHGFPPGAGAIPSLAWRDGSSSVGASRPPERLLVARAPAQVPAGQELSVDVRLVTEGRPVHSDAVTARLENLLVADDGTPVTVTVHAPAGLHADGPLQQTVLVKPDEDPDPIRFGFGAQTPGLHRIDVTAWAGGTFLSEVSVEVSVADGGPFRDGRLHAAPLNAPQARPGEVTMEVRFDGSRYTFQLRSDAALFAPVVESITNPPTAAVENAIKELQQLAGGGSRYNATMTREVIRSAGIQLWSELVPADVRDQFWQVGADMSAFTIATDHDVVPWELLYPLSAQHDAGFLVEQVPVVRRTYGQRRNARVGLRNPRFVVPPKAPTGAHEEIATIRAILGAADSEPITRADELLALINAGALGAIHFACHNTFSSDGSFIDMDGGRFKPALLAEASIRKLLAETGPLVFINACRSAGVAPTYTKMLGWAQQFMSSGAGAFVGTLWAVRSDSSARFATAFYRSLADGATLGAAALAARVEQQDDPLDPTWLAYTVYGDPFATAAV